MRRLSRLVGFFSRLRKVARSFPSFSSSSESIEEETLDKIDLKGLQLFGYHGVTLEEKRNGQSFLIDVSLFLKLRQHKFDDGRKHRINYASVYEDIEQVIRGPSMNLIEQLAEKMCTIILEEYPPIKKVQVSIRKLDSSSESLGSVSEVSTGNQDILSANVKVVRSSPVPLERRTKKTDRNLLS
eukprot:g2893.t1